jgi:tetrahydromethanopterin S-methyltransferase subunit B
MSDIANALEQFVDSRLSVLKADTQQKFSRILNIINSKNTELSGTVNERIKILEKYCTELQNAINSKNTEFSVTITRRDERIKILEKYCADLQNAINSKNTEFSVTIIRQEERIKTLEKYCAEFQNALNSKDTEFSLATRQEERIKIPEKHGADLSNAVNSFSSRIGKFEKAEETAGQAETDSIVQRFNRWAGDPITPLPSAFSFLAGDFRIRTNQQLVFVPEETKWCINREGEKKYLLPNPNSFNQMTNILELYEMDQRFLREKGKNKIKILSPCEISPSGFVELPGKLELLS